MNLELREALTQISEIRSQLARTELFRGYRALPVAFSGLIAVLAALAQAAWLREPQRSVGSYVALWVGAAIVSASASVWGMIDRRRRSASAWTREATCLALEQFLPSVVAGGMLTALLLVTAPENTWMLPGLWQVLFSLGIFASSRLLPAPLRLVASWYLITGITCLAIARGDAALSAWAMGLPFGLGQAMAAMLLYLTLERDNGGRR